MRGFHWAGHGKGREGGSAMPPARGARSAAFINRQARSLSVTFSQSSAVVVPNLLLYSSMISGGTGKPSRRFTKTMNELS